MCFVVLLSLAFSHVAQQSLLITIFYYITAERTSRNAQAFNCSKNELQLCYYCIEIRNVHLFLIREFNDNFVRFVLTLTKL